jgi:hypothetical protein
MRLFLLLVAVTACSGSAGDGAVLTFVAPDLEATPGARIEIVLASADPATISTAEQRLGPTSLATEEVVYYRQRATGGVLTGVTTVDGFTVRIEPHEDLVPDTSFIPFALIYDDRDALIAIGTANGDSGEPAEVVIDSGVVADYAMTVQRVTPASDTGVGRVVICQGEQGAWTSGAAWNAANGSQLRLLLPDLSHDPAATDASEREADLDCDDHEALDEDCDDLRIAFYDGQTETCDGLDTDCDGHRLEVIEGCALAPGVCGGAGYSICGEDGALGMASSACRPDATCACAPGSGQACTACVLDWRAASGAQAPCAPAIGKLFTEGCAQAGCTVDVVDVDGPWEIKLALTEAGPFTSTLTGVPTGPFYVRATYLGSAGIPTATPSIGTIYLSSWNGTRLIATSVELQLKPGAVMQCPPTPSNPSLGNSLMYCSG